MFAPPPTTWLAAMRAPLPWSPLGRMRPYARACPSTVCALGRASPYCRARPTTIRAPLLFVPYEAFAPHKMCAPPVRTHGSHSRPIPCAPLEYKFIKIVVHSTTWASKPSTTVRWMTARYLGADHSFLVHSHGPRVHLRTWLYACLI
jgi:hypothetical protein